MIELKNVSMLFGSGKSDEGFRALDDVSLTIPKGCVYGFLGSNGAGKSTLMRMMCGVYKTDEGSITIDGEEVYDNPAAKSKIFFVNDETVQYTNFTFKELKNYYADLYENFSDEVFDRLSGKLNLPMNKKLSEFSKGMKRQAIVIIGLSCMTEYLMLDEAFDGLDPAMRKIVKDMIVDEMLDRDAAIIVSSHNIAEINELCDRAMLIHKGKLIFADEIDEIKGSFRKIQIASGKRRISREDIEGAGINVMQYSSLGSVSQVIVRGSEESIMAQMKTLAPDILEIIPLTLEEIFIYELEVRGYGSSVIKED